MIYQIDNQKNLQKYGTKQYDEYMTEEDIKYERNRIHIIIKIETTKANIDREYYRLNKDKYTVMNKSPDSKESHE